MKNKPIVTLFMLMSVDGKISTGALDDFDMDKDLPKIKGVKEGLHQYYEIEQTTDLWALNTGRVQAKMGVNELPFPKKSKVSFVILDNHHLTAHGIEYFCKWAKEFVLVTGNANHPAFTIQQDNLHILKQETLNLSSVLECLHEEFGCERLTVQSGGTINSLFLREQLFDYIDIIVAPILIGGKHVTTLIDGDSIQTKDEFHKLGVLSLMKCEVLENSYLRLTYKMIKDVA